MGTRPGDHFGEVHVARARAELSEVCLQHPGALVLLCAGRGRPRERGRASSHRQGTTEARGAAKVGSARPLSFPRSPAPSQSRVVTAQAQQGLQDGASNGAGGTLPAPLPRHGSRSLPPSLPNPPSSFLVPCLPRLCPAQPSPASPVPAWPVWAMGEERDERPRPDVSLCSQHLEVQRSGWLPSKDTLMHLVECALLQKHARPGVAPQTPAVHPAASESWKDPLAFLASPGTPQGKGTQSLSPLELHSHTTQATYSGCSCNCPGGDQAMCQGS